MMYDKIINGRVHGAEWQELQGNSEELFATDVREILNDERLAQGVFFSFGSDRAAFEKMITVLGVDKDFENYTKGGYINHVQGVYGTYNGHGGRRPDVVLPLIERYGFTGALQLLQAESWSLEDKRPRGERIVVPEDRAMSGLIFMHSDPDEKGEPQTMAGSMGISISMTTTMGVDSVADHGSYPEMSLVEVYKTVHQDARTMAQIPGELGDFLKSYDDELIFPGVHYSLSIGPTQGGGFQRTVDGVRTRGGYYNLVNGRFVRNAERSGDAEGESEPFEWPTPEQLERFSSDEDDYVDDYYTDLDDDDGYEDDDNDLYPVNTTDEK